MIVDLDQASTDAMESLSETPSTETEIPHQENQCLLKLISPPKLLHSFTLTNIYNCHHISSVTPNRIWIRDTGTLILTDTTGVPLHYVGNVWHDFFFFWITHSEQ